MIYAVLLEDDDSQAGERAKHMQEHLAFLERNAASIDSAGPLKDAKTGEPAGGLWLVRADNAEEVRAHIEADPFWPTGLRKSVRILEWTQVFAGGRRRI
ncbi:YciI family protein [Inquilinus sp. CAU 1745]|uniref:YciI family protein n=1 Tax=Inquilinus sp. CAU 1745 TaxID=3140369 RepID=UPI00325BF453